MYIHKWQYNMDFRYSSTNQMSHNILKYSSHNQIITTQLADIPTNILYE